ncbi:MAG: hypothetical protein WDM87_07200 [Terracidiphilus sp.]
MPLVILGPHYGKPRNCCDANRTSTAKGWSSCAFTWVNPSDNSFGTAVITPRWLFVLAAATPQSVGDPILIDESLEQIVPESIHPRATSSASASTPATPSAAMQSVAWLAPAAHGSYTAAFMPRSFLRKRSSAARHTP